MQRPWACIGKRSCVLAVSCDTHLRTMVTIAYSYEHDDDDDDAFIRIYNQEQLIDRIREANREKEPEFFSPPVSHEAMHEGMMNAYPAVLHEP